MKKILTAILAAAVLFTMAGCSGRPATMADVPQGPTDVEETPAPESQGSIRTGLYAVGSLSSSASAGEADGLIQTDVTIVAVTVDAAGVITDCVIDSVQAKANFDGQGQVLTDLSAPVPSKNELGADYGMGPVSASMGGIGKEWNEQAQALADYVVGKTADEVLGIAVDEATKPAEADLASSVTISIGGFQSAIAEAVDRAQPLGAQAGDELRLVTSNSMAPGNAPEGAAGMVETNVNIAAVTMNGDAITSCVIDAVQAQVSFDGQGQLLTDLSAPVPSKNDRGADYGMGAVSSIGKEWNEQAAAFAAYVTGKTLDEVAGIAVDEATKPAEADLASSVTISIGGFQNAIAEAVDRAQPLGAQAGDELRLVTSNSMAAGNAPEGAAGMVETNVNIAAVTMNGDAITSCVIDAVQAQVSFDGQGQLLTDLSAPVPSKNDRGADYGMGAVSSIGKEWNEQAAAFAAYVTGKTLDEVAGIAVDEATKPAEADLASSVTISIGGFQALLEKLR